MSLRRIRHALVRRVVAPLVTLAMRAGDLAHDLTDDILSEDLTEACWDGNHDNVMRCIDWVYADGSRFDLEDMGDIPLNCALEVRNFILIDLLLTVGAGTKSWCTDTEALWY